MWRSVLRAEAPAEACLRAEEVSFEALNLVFTVLTAPFFATLAFPACALVAVLFRVWDFSVFYDNPAQFDYILEETGLQKIAYMGHS